MSRPATLPLCLLLACGGNEAASPNTAPSSPAAAPAKAAKSPTLTAPASRPREPSGAALPTSAGPTSAGPTSAGPTSAGPVPGPIDPAWLRVDMFPGAAVASSGRTARDDAGLFSTQLLLTLAEGTTREACVDTVTAALASAVPALERKDGPDGRVTLTGSNDDYAATIVCGEAKGKMSAYLSYRWLRAPKSP